MIKYCAIESRHQKGKYIVCTIGPMHDFTPIGSIRDFTTFDEANSVAKDCSNGLYGYTHGLFVNMR